MYGTAICYYGCCYYILYYITGILLYRENRYSTYPPWSFPCRCTDGCNTDTGDCLNGGTCIPDIPVGYTWSGQACRYGKIYPICGKYDLLQTCKDNPE